jgi:GNAT superfamily N-acetyltransferase
MLRPALIAEFLTAMRVSAELPSAGVSAELPSAEDYLGLRRSVGWETVSVVAVERAFAHTLRAGSIFDGEGLCAFGRVVGDAGLYFYVQDVMVRPVLQGRGLGSAVVRALVTWLREAAGTDAVHRLQAMPGTEEFYRQLGFARQPSPDTLMELTS